MFWEICSAVSSHRFRLLDRGVHRFEQYQTRDWLREIGTGPGGKRFLLGLRLVMSGDDHDRQCRMHCSQTFEYVETSHSRHMQIEHGAIRSVRAHDL